MPLSVMHLVDQEVAADSLEFLALLLRAVPRERLVQSVTCIGPGPAARLPACQARIHTAGRRFGLAVGSLPDVQRIARREDPDVLLAWGAGAGAVGRMAWRRDRSVGVVISDPAAAATCSRWGRSLSGWFRRPPEFLCTAQLVQRRLVEAGVPLESTTVLRPAVDFGALRRARERLSRADLGLPAGERVLLTLPPPTRRGGQFYAAWAAAILHQLWPGARLLIPGMSREQARLRRLAASLYCPEVIVLTEDRFTFAELLGVADMAIAPAVGDVPTGYLAWAMASGAPIVASAVPSVTEFIADRHNGFLCRAGEPQTLAIRIRTAAESGDLSRRCAEVARGQAYDVFRSQPCIENYTRAVEVLSSGGRAAEALTDTAIA